MEGFVSRGNKYIFSLIWSLPLVVMFFLCVSILWPVHTTLMLRAFALCLGFASTMSFVYRRVPVIGVAVFAGIAAIIVFGLMPHPVRHLYWALVVTLAVMESVNFCRDLSPAK